MPANFVNFIVTQYASKYKAISTADEDKMALALRDLNTVLETNQLRIKSQRIMMPNLSNPTMIMKEDLMMKE